jgi:hypothetical protein
VALLSISVAFAVSACGGLTTDAQQAQSLRGAAKLVAQEAADGKLTAPYARTQSEELADAAASLVEQLRGDPGDPKLRGQALTAAEATRDGMRALAQHPDDRRLAAEIARRLGEQGS